MTTRQSLNEQAEAVLGEHNTVFRAYSTDPSCFLLALAADIHSELGQSDNPEVPTLSSKSFESLEKTLHQFAFAETSFSSSIRRRLDNEGAKLWNASLQKMNGSEVDKDAVLLCKVRTLAYAMLDTAAPRNTAGLGNYRSLELAFGIIKACLGLQLVNLSQSMMELAATRLDMLESASIDSEPESRLEAAATEYYTLRIHLAWSQGRCDIADHLFSKIPEVKTKRQQEAIVDICYMIGNKSLSLGQYEVALAWLDRALVLCEPSEGDDVEQYMKDKRLLVLHGSIRAKLHAGTADSGESQKKAMDFLQKEYGDRFPAIAIFLEVFNKRGVIGQEFVAILESAIEVVDGNEASIKILYHYLEKLRDSSLELFVKACGLLIARLGKVALESKKQWMERIFVSTIWALTSSDHPAPLLLAETVACRLTGSSIDKLSEDATNVSLMLIWKCVDTLVAKGLVDIAEKWCCFALNLKQPIFQLTPDAEAKYFRSPGLSPQRIFDAVPKSCKACPMTLYLLYRLALYIEDGSLATVYLKSLGQSNADPTYIQACMTDAVQLGRIKIAIQSLEGLITVLECDYGQPQLSQLAQYLIDTICKMGAPTIHPEGVVQLLESISRKQTRLFPPTVSYWFACKSYCIAFDIHGTTAPKTTLKLVEIATKFIEAVEPGADLEMNPNPVDLYLHCIYLQAAITTKEARGKEDPSVKANHYKKVREVIKQFKTHTQSLSVDKQGPWLEKHRITLSIDFEAAVFLQQWHELGKILEDSKPIVDSKLASIFLDCILQSDASSSSASRAVKLMIRTLHSSPLPYLNTPTSSFSETLPRYFRVLFALSHQGNEHILAESVVDQALLLARDHPSAQSHYPTEEVEWLATSTFNQAVDFFLNSADGECQRWARKAIELADCIRGRDHGRLGSLLRAKFEKLQAP
ncbi:meiosis protein SPO22/ZIP4 like-domain-containing protein [Aspergillus pseudoustus]|uniref:Meiosis protein SPO22/ZIP4 like-domain-containing protein n=1 Tax=Aspergillus pseudoustus TaxID=1810923 RepID=A0ABR4KE87_9EURO